MHKKQEQSRYFVLLGISGNLVSVICSRIDVVCLAIGGETVDDDTVGI